MRLVWAVLKGRENVVRSLGSGADTDVLGKDRRTALYWARKRNFEGIRRLLVEKGVN